jgi:hypothetical protein
MNLIILYNICKYLDSTKNSNIHDILFIKKDREFILLFILA